ncbi:MAG: hypothetical protein JST96_03130 [Bacteroidetes bacterium]|nr:hypothetical protein [Bacteroidota bacterium]
MKMLHSMLSLVFFAVVFTANARPQEDWPKTITASDGSMIKIYEPQPESFQGNILKSRSAISIIENGKTDPTFGTFWEIATVETDRDNRRINIQSVKIPNMKFPSSVDENQISYLKTTLETQIPAMGIDLSLDEVLSSLDVNAEQKKLSKDLDNKAPIVYYSNRPSILVVTDGEPKLQRNNDWGVDVVVNTPFTIVKNNDGNFYLYGGKHWYTAASVTGPYSYVENVPPSFGKIENAINTANADPGYTDSATAENNDKISDIIVSTSPAELIQTDGDPTFTQIDGTNLAYVSNSGNDIFLDQSTKQYYVLLSGRWYRSSQLNGGWQYVAANALPADFGKIPEGSQKDNVLASVAGTDAAREAVMDAQIPQTAKVDRRTATANVMYDGEPQFDNIQGTNMQYGVNTQNSVIRSNGRYYCVDNGVWFVADAPQGPWVVATDRPDEVDLIPPSCPVYNIKYVYVYDVTPDWVYMGYTPGYLNTFIYGPTVVYGTGFYYRPWWGHYYYPRPCTWGFAMHYNPWYGWSLGFGYSYGWFNIGFGTSIWGGWRGGWWGPAVYHPPYRWYGGASRYGYRGGYYGNRVNITRNVTINNRRYTNNIYNYRRDVVTTNRTVNNNFNRGNFNNNRPNDGFNRNNNQFNRQGNNINPGNRMAPNQGQQRPNFQNNITTDRQGNVFQRNNQGQWQQRQQRQWQPVQNSQQVQNLNRQQQMQNRGQMRQQNFQMSRPSNNGGGARPSGGGNRPNGGGGRRNR